MYYVVAVCYGGTEISKEGESKNHKGNTMLRRVMYIFLPGYGSFYLGLVRIKTLANDD